MSKVLVINGPNLNLIGQRETGIYGTLAYEEFCEKLRATAVGKDIRLEIYQSNHEGEIVDRIQSAHGKFDVIIINAGAYTHTSVAIRDAFLATNMPFIEVHISNIYKREEFRRKSYLSDIADGIIAGFGTDSYFLALEGVETILASRGK